MNPKPLVDRSPSRRIALPLCAMASALAVLGWSAPAAVAQTAAAADGSTQTVTVTSVRKKLEAVQDVPATINVLSGADLAAAGVNDVRGIEYKIPGLALGDKGFDGASIGIRGNSSIRGFTGDESAVAVHLDGIYVPQSGAALGRLFDVARIETLYGPQGSLYGRNAVAGVIDIVSNAPGKVFGGSAQLSRGSFGTTASEGVLNLPLNESNGVRLAFSAARGDGYVRNVLDSRTAGNDDFTAGRLRYAGQLGAGLKADLTLQVSQTDGLPAVQPGRLNDTAAGTAGVGFYQTAVDTNEYVRRKDGNLALKFDLALGDLTLRAITGYTTYSRDLKLDTELTVTAPPAIGTGSRGYQDSKAWSQEFNLLSNGQGALDWRVGAYFTGSKVNERRNTDDTASPFGAGFFDDFKLRQDGRAQAVFGTVDWTARPGLTASVGLRYNTETKDQSQDETVGVVPPSAAVPDCSATGGGALICNSKDRRKFSWSGTSGDATLKWQLSPQTMVYARAARGFRSGAVGGIIGFDNAFDQLGGGPGTFTLLKLKPESMDSYEIGVKNSLFNRTLLLNAAAYRNKAKDLLVITFDPATFRSVEGNLGETITKGLDLNAAWVPNRSWRVDASLNYSDGSITRVGDIVIGAKVGNRPIYAPLLSAAVAVGYKAGLWGGTLSANVEANHKDQMYFDLGNRSGQAAVDLFNVNAAWEAPGGRWWLFGAVNNLGDKQYLTYGQRTDAGAGPGPKFSYPGAPRTVRLGAGLRF